MKYETPVCEILKLNESDVIATSTPIVPVVDLDALNQDLGI